MAAIGHPIVVRRAEPGDAEAIHATFTGPRAIAGTLQLPYPSVEQWRKRLAEFPPGDHLLVATIAGEVVGNLGLHAASKSPRRKHVATIGMAVRDDRQGRGVGSALLLAAVELADGWLNYQRLELTAYVDNLAAVQLYRKFGFTIEGTARAYAFRDGAYVDAYWMARLSPAFGRMRLARTRTKDEWSDDASRFRRMARNGRLGADAAHARGERFRADRTGLFHDVERRRQRAARSARHVATACATQVDLEAFKALDAIVTCQGGD